MVIRRDAKSVILSDREGLRFTTAHIKSCWFSTLNDLDFNTKVSVWNPLPSGNFGEEVIHLDLLTFNETGNLLSRRESIKVLEPQERWVLDLSQALGVKDGEKDVVAVLHFIPGSLRDFPEVKITPQRLIEWTSMCDEFIGYRHRISDVSSGVHYQSPAVNDHRLASTRSMIIQSPKIVINDDTDTSLLACTPTSDDNYKGSVDLQILVAGQDGTVFARDTIRVRARCRIRVSIKDILMAAGTLDHFCSLGGLGMLAGFSSNGVIFPLMITHSKAGGLAIDHSLPPPYYAPWWGGGVRKDALQVLSRRWFSGPVQ